VNLGNKTILIIGGAMGIGRATAKICAERGGTVIIADIDTAAGEQTARELNVTFIPVNVTDEESVKKLFAQIEQLHGHLDVLIQTAGVLKGAYLPIEDFTVEMWRTVQDVNVLGTFLCVKHAVPLLKKSVRGVIVLTSSIAATAGSSSYAYGTSKGGVSSLGITMANKLAEFNIRVNVVSPGNITSNMKLSVIAADAEKRGQNFEKLVAESDLGEPDGVGRVLAWLASDDADYVRGFISTR
jgi:NAD(P)-dependent dehydrogenase (short-subunit alcohol dehydrogenase family)